MILPSDGRIRRTQHYAPGSSWAILEKAAASDADSVILELEDGVAEDKKEDARAQVVRALDTLDFGDKEVLVRINHLDTEWGVEDLAAIAHHPRLDGIMLPKVETLEYIKDVRSAAPGRRGSAPGPCP